MNQRLGSSFRWISYEGSSKKPSLAEAPSFTLSLSLSGNHEEDGPEGRKLRVGGPATGGKSMVSQGLFQTTPQ